LFRVFVKTLWYAFWTPFPCLKIRTFYPMRWLWLLQLKIVRKCVSSF